ncbi:carbohydrate ABC transporter permease [Paenibacillus sp. J2TS4]|uniref:carbohydrate ABC transporter permease n=1 Tax=Paenibacillus sp. J2TS4 TaxID=2807194 RepID=UPI001B2E0E38|nr:carbohydrate ABC transporter permease [Paenibacillus sp. J2TS4]GIP36134.1 bicyclomycin resistance protein [Paenibacillus sp. J2TS4]
MTSNKTVKAIIHIILIIVGIIWIYPFIWMVSSSLKNNMTFFTSGINPIPKEWRWDNYVRAWEVAQFSDYFMNSVIITVSTVIIVVVLSCMTGYALGRVAFPGRTALIAGVVALQFIPKGYTIIPLYQLVNYLGLKDSYLGVIFAESSGAHVLFILLFAAFFSKVPKEIEESAEIDGCGFVRTFASIVLPTAKPVIATVSIMQFIWTWSSFLVPLVLTINKPELRTLSVGMLSFTELYATDWTGMAAGATIALLPVMLIFIFMQRYFYEGISGAVK